ncbi:MAG: NYN domain-containing protein [Microbacterium sp.]|uniref:NYN domain-containing protein n=1 Tax=Microbacterium sp. TaxID=51671 RepID=UPI001ACF772B|nr:NYN domain-containing protein [Microbacterium sp.]MBN9153408.1 NYN domain-containing protein [Microbacterium sp.]MBN9195160.1 NYN domain-containing protein [Microbacterium sp.]
MTDDRDVTWVLVDGENIDATLGTAILGRRPQPDERPRWDRLRTFVERTWGRPARGVFFLNASTGIPMAFVQALKAMDYIVVPLSGDADEKVVDIAIQRTLQALTTRSADVMLVSHDGDFLDDLGALIDGRRRVGVVAFSEFRNAGFSTLPGLERFDLEYDAGVFDAPLPRIRVIPIDEFDPNSFLG